MKRIAKDIGWILSSDGEDDDVNKTDPGELWNGNENTVSGGINYAVEDKEIW